MHKNLDLTNPRMRNILSDHRVIEKAPLVVALPLRFRAPSSLRLKNKGSYSGSGGALQKKGPEGVLWGLSQLLI